MKASNIYLQFDLRTATSNKIMTTFNSVISFFFLCIFLVHVSDAQLGPTTEGYTCSVNETTVNPCQAYAYYRASVPSFTDLAAIADLFSVSRLMISKPSNLSNPSSPLIQNQPDSYRSRSGSDPKLKPLRGALPVHQEHPFLNTSPSLVDTLLTYRPRSPSSLLHDDGEYESLELDRGGRHVQQRRRSFRLGLYSCSRRCRSPESIEL